MENKQMDTIIKVGMKGVTPAQFTHMKANHTRALKQFSKTKIIRLKKEVVEQIQKNNNLWTKVDSEVDGFQFYSGLYNCTMIAVEDKTNKWYNIISPAYLRDTKVNFDHAHVY